VSYYRNASFFDTCSGSDIDLVCRCLIIEIHLFLTYVANLRYVPGDMTFDFEPYTSETCIGFVS